MRLTNGIVNDTVKSAIEICSASAKEKNIEFKLEADSDLSANINDQLLEQALINLLTNAIRYSPESNTVKVKLTQTDGSLILSVEDNGCGIEDKHLPRIFERFYRIEKDRSRKLGGTGLGLAIVKHIAKVHNGRVEVKSVIGRGSIFKIIIPAKT